MLSLVPLYTYSILFRKCNILLLSKLNLNLVIPKVGRFKFNKSL